MFGQPEAGPPISAGSVVLRPLTPAAASALIAGDLSGVKAGAGWPHNDTIDGMRMVAQGLALGWLVQLGDTVIGDCGTHGPVNEVGSVEIGYGLAAPYRGHGYGRELVSALVRWLLDEPHVVEVAAFTRTGNTPSRVALERAGFRLAGETDGQCHYLLHGDP